MLQATSYKFTLHHPKGIGAGLQANKGFTQHHFWFYKNGAGFTLIEILIYLAIIGLVATSLLVFSLSVNSSRAKTYVTQEVQANIRSVSEFISSKIRGADDVVSPTESNSAETLVLDMPEPVPDLTFSVISGVLTVAEGAGEPRAITSNETQVSHLNFTNLAGLGERDNILIEISIDYRLSDDQTYQYSQSLKTAVSLRK